MASKDGIIHGEGSWPTVFDPNTCAKKGRVEVGHTRGSQPYKLYYEIHGNPNAKDKLIFSE